MRCFIAIDVPFVKDFKLYQNKIKNFGEFKFPNSFHLTLKFLGDVKDINIVKEKLRKVKFKPFKVRFGKIGAFPNLKRINVIWVSLIPEEKIKSLQKSVEDVLRQLFQKENREFKTHITLARVKYVKDKESVLESFNTKLGEEFIIDKFKLVKSELTSKGPIYTVLGEYDGKEM